jgi:hypothetical protein
MGRSFGPSPAGRVGLLSASFQYLPISADLVFLFLNDEPTCSHIARTWVGTKIYFARVNPSREPDLVVRDHLATAVCPVSAVVASVLVFVVV